MSLDAIIGIVGGIVGGLLSGAVAARYQAKAQVEAVRVGVEGEIDRLKLEHDIARQDREQEAAASEHRAKEELRGEVRLASLELASALREPDAMGVNVRNAQRTARNAAARVPPGSPLRAVAEKLVQASEDKDLAAAQAVMSELSSPMD